MNKMLCSVCKKNEAKVHYKTSINGDVKEMFLCHECAKKNGITAPTAFEFADSLFDTYENGDIFGGLLSGMMKTGGVKQAQEKTKCPLCGMYYSEFVHGGKMGCGECYRTFASLIEPTIKRIHGNAEHCGKVPEGRMSELSEKKKITALRQQLDIAVKNQEYELCAKIRDEIKEIEARLGKAGE